MKILKELEGLPVFLNMLVLVRVVSGFGTATWTLCGSSFSESLPPLLNIETRVSIPTWSHPSTDLDLVANGFALVFVFIACCWVTGFLTSTSSGISSGESSMSSLSLFSVKFTLIYKIERIGESKREWS